ncbi:MAG: replication-relaxation family protein [Bdellovibrionales bacterium]|nr:replication-relaxation family protein [Bdellovibrionales bacterium]
MARAKGVIVTARDTALLRELYEQTVMSYRQVAARHFKGAAHPTVYNRLSRLMRAGLMSRFRVGMVIHQGGREEIGSVYRITKRGIAWLKTVDPSGTFRDEPVPLNTYTLAHDLVLNDAMAALSLRFPGSSLVHGKLMTSLPRAGARVPDAVMKCTGAEPKWSSVELELSAKSAKRYREIILQYRLSPDFGKVLYVVGNEGIAAKIKAEILGHKVQPGGPQMATGKFYFVTLAALLGSAEAAKIANGQEEFGARTVNQNLQKGVFI